MSALTRLAVLRNWWPARRRAALGALGAGLLTAVLLRGAAGPGAGWSTSALYAAVVVVALAIPAGIAVQVIVGQLLIARLLMADQGPGVLELMPLVALVVLTAELLTLSARLDTPMERVPTGEGFRVLFSGALGAAVFAPIALIVGVPGATGPAAVLLASAALVAASWMLYPTADP